MSEKLLYKIEVHGRVQGVGYRYSALREAMILGITGYVKNMADGSVYIEAEGTKEQLDAFVKWCRRGPGMGHVGTVNVSTWPTSGYEKFRIEY